MKNSIILKTLLILGSLIFVIFLGFGYFFMQSDKQLTDEISKYNLKSAIKSLDAREKESLSDNKTKMKDIVKTIAKNSSIYLLDYNLDGLKEALSFDMKREGVKAISVWDNEVDELFLLVAKKDDKIIFKTTLDKSYDRYVKFEQNIEFVDNGASQVLGKITFYYDESVIIDKIDKLKSDAVKEIDAFNKTIDEKLAKSARIKFIMAVIALSMILAVSSFLLITFVNKPLKILQKNIDSFFLFLQNKKDTVNTINIDTTDEFGQMSEMLNQNIIVSTKLHQEIYELNTNLEKLIEEKTKKVTTLLNNAGQGFLTFNKEFIIDAEYSKECEKYLGKNIANVDIAELLLVDKAKVKSFKSTFLDMLEIKSKVARKSMLSLLPAEIILNKRALKLEYKILEDDNFMLIITNVSAEKKLQKKIEKEQSLLKMIVTIVGEKDTFFDLKKDFEYFATNTSSYINSQNTPLNNINTLYREIHTFKGSFLQFSMNATAKYLHAVETNIVKELLSDSSILNDDINTFINKIDFEQFIKDDLDHIAKTLGNKFLESEHLLSVESSVVNYIKEQYDKLCLKNNIDDNESQQISSQIEKLLRKSLKAHLSVYPRLAQQTAHRLGKEIYDFEIICDNDVIVEDEYKPFIKSLIHVFRNSVDHGIETPEQRVSIDKDEIGTISCNIVKDNENVKIIISDDGAGIDADKIRTKLNKSGVDTTNMKDEDIYLYIFEDNFSTKDKVTEISGRGVGMSAVKSEIEKLDGEISIKTTANVGTSLIFTLPINLK